MPTQREIIQQLRHGRISLPPLSIRVLEEAGPEPGQSGPFDAVVEISWREQSARFVVESKSPATPRAFRDGLNQLKLADLPAGYRPLLILPYLREQHLQELDQAGISGLDLCGNGVVVAPGAFAIYRTGGENRFSTSAPIKNIYRKNSSMVGRVFFARSIYQTVQEVHAEIDRRNLLVSRWHNRPMSLSTVSKALKTLVEDLIIERSGGIRLLQPDRLLQKLSDNYAPPQTGERARLKLPEASGPVWAWLQRQARELELPIMATGVSSVTRYTVMQRGEILSAYCPRLDVLLDCLPASRSDRFPNLELIETDDETVYFDAQQADGFWWASPLQVYLELMAGDKRDQETAEQVKSLLLANLGGLA